MRISLLPAVLLAGIAACVAPWETSTAEVPAGQPWLFPFTFTGPRAGRLDLSNFTFASAEVEAIVTPYPDCAPHPGLVARRHDLQLNATWTIAAPPGSDICWRRVPSVQQQSGGQGMQSIPARTEWNRAFTGAGRFIDAQL